MSRFFAEQPLQTTSPTDVDINKKVELESPAVQSVDSDPATKVSGDLASPAHDTRSISGSPRKSATPTTDARKADPFASQELLDTVSRLQQNLKTHSRFDAISGRWTIFAVGRDERPNDYVTVPPKENTNFECPFCSGHEHQTPPSVLEVTANQCDSLSMHGSPGSWETQTAYSPWAIRVIPNKYPAVDSNEVAEEPTPYSLPKASPRSDYSGTGALFRSREITGGHEVFIESSGHDQSLLTLDLSQVTMLLHAYQLRMRYWRSVPSIAYISVFKNEGPAAGASLHHSHSQLIATSELPIAAKATADRMKLHWAKTGCCLQCDTVRAEIKAKKRVVAVTDSLIAYCPYGSHLPMQVRITSKRHLDCYEDLTIHELEEMARLLRGCIRWMQAIYPDVSYNYLIQTRPPAISGDDMSHWALELFPRITQVAGFEWSSDCMINPILPEVAAATYREVAVSENPLR
jgi:UDPglucose--hexose-1-phosphate uridylyltransferase